MVDFEVHGICESSNKGLELYYTVQDIANSIQQHASFCAKLYVNLVISRN